MTAKQNFDGTPSTVIATTSTLSDGTFTVDSTNATITEFDNSTDLWPLVVLRCEISETFEAAPDADSSLDVYITRSDQGGTDDPTPPTMTDAKSAEYVGRFKVYATDEAQYPNEITVSMVGVRQAKFFFQNNTGATLNYSSVGVVVTAEGVSLEDV